MLIIFTGNGKGKTTAAIGQAVRAVGDGKKVLMIQFIKGPWKSGEDVSHKKLLPFFRIVKMGKGFVGIGNDKLPIKVHRESALNGLKYATKQMERGVWDFIILDEIWNALKLKLLTKKDILCFINKAECLVDHLILTGRDCPTEFIKSADLVTEMKEIKHPFSKNITGSKGVEF